MTSSKKKQAVQKKTEKDIRIIGIGASAGGLEALQVFFRNVSDNSGHAFVVIQHLSPDYKSMMDELLSRHTKMDIAVIEDGISIKPNTIYLIPPRKNLKLFNNQLFLTKQDNQTVLNLPIDIFFRSLADEKGKDAIGIILSGTGSDGTMGTRAIKEKHGMVMVQNEGTAKFNGMPASAISTGLVDYILAPEDMGRELGNYLRHPLVIRKAHTQEIPRKGMDAMSKVVMLLKEYSGIDFSYYKENTINRRLERRISINRFNNLDDYLIYLEDSDHEKEILYREFLIGVTQFFRDKEAYHSLEENVLENIFTNNRKVVRVWTTGCSTGEEAYSIAIQMHEVAEKHQFKGEIKIFASDIDKRSIDIAGKGFYPDSIIADIEPSLLIKYFARKDDGYQVKEDIRNSIVFATHNVLKDPPFSKLDMIVCRNLFIYLKPEIQLSLLSRFYYSLLPEGYLFMGNSETLGGMSDAFEVIDQKNKIYKFKKGYNPPIVDSLSLGINKSETTRVTQTNGNSSERKSKQSDILSDVINDFVPPSIIVDSNYYIINVINNINPITEIQAGNYTNELFSILPKDLGLFVNNLLRQLKNKEKNKISRNIAGIKSLKNKTIKIEGRKIQKNDQLYFMLTFELLKNTPESTKDQRNEAIHIESEKGVRIVELEKDLKTAKENLAATVEELESANEELQSSNEELIASNEELQSTNEELQSVNEELYTVNSEHQQKIEELTRLNNDINNLLKNTEIAAIYLDSKLCIRKITPHVSKVTNVIDTDIGRPITHLSVIDSYPDLANDAYKVTETLKPIDKEIIGKDNQPFFARLRPYRTFNNAVDGVMITFVDISELKSLKQDYIKSQDRLTESLKLGNMAWWDWNIKTGHVTYSDRKATMLGYKPAEFPNDVYEICDLIHPDDYESTMNEMREVIDGKKKEWNVKYRMRCKDGNYKWYQDHGSIKEKNSKGKASKMFGMVIDITQMQEIEHELEMNNRLMEMIVEQNPASITMVNAEGQITFANKEAQKLFNISQEQLADRSYDDSKWKITDKEGKPIPAEKLPFFIIKKTKKPLIGFEHYIKVSTRNNMLLQIDGAPLMESGTFKGVVFCIRSIN